MKLGYALIVFLLTTGFLNQVMAQEAIRATRLERERIEINLEAGHVILIGAVRIDYGDVSLRCDRAVVWADMTSREDASKPTDKDEPKLGGMKLKEIFGEGEVVVRQAGRVVECSSIFIDVLNDRALATRATLSESVPLASGNTRLTIRAEELQQVNANVISAKNVGITSSPFGKPGWELKSESVLFQRDPKAEKNSVANMRLEVDPSVISIGGLPLLPLPSITANSEASLFGYLKNVEVSGSGQFGPAAAITFGDEITVDDERWGDWFLRTRYLGERGPGVGADVFYERAGEYRGRFWSMYQNDHGRDELFGEPPDHDRGRIKLQHRHWLDKNTQLDAELSILSDRGYLPEYHESEFQSDKEQETLLYLKHTMENRVFNVLAKKRLNSFQDQTENLPSAGFNLIYEPLIDIDDETTIYFDADYELGYYRHAFPRGSGLKTVDSMRLDLDQKLVLPFNAGAVKVYPYAGVRYSWYSEGRNEDNLSRIGTLYGVKLSTELWKTYAREGGFFNLFGLRHIVTPSIEYQAIDHVSGDPQDFYQFDRIDAYSENERIIFGLRNRFQTLWETEDGHEVVDVLSLEIDWTWFPHRQRDGGGSNAGNLDFDFFMRPSREFVVLVDFEYSFRLDTFETFNATLGWTPDPRFQMALGYRRYVDVNDAVLVQANWRLSPRYGLQFQSVYDFQEREFLDQRLLLQKIGADFVFQIEFEYDQGSNDFGVHVSFSPRALFDPRLRARSLRNLPRVASFGDGLLR